MINRQPLSEGSFSSAIALHQRGEFEAAESIYRSILAIEPRNFEAAHALGVLSLQRGQFKKAEQQLSFAIKLKPSEASPYNNRGYALIELNRVAEAIESYNKAIEIEPGNIASLYNRANALSRIHRYEEAVDDYSRALKLAPSAAQIHNNRGIALNELNRFEEAIQSFNKAIEIQPQNPASFLNLAGALLNTQPQLALNNINRTIELEPSAKAYSIQGSALTLLKKYDGAIAAYEKALALDPQIEFVRGSCVLNKLYACDWNHLQENIDKLLEDIQDRNLVTGPFVLFALPNTSRLQLKCARLHTERMEPAISHSLWKRKASPCERIHVGYMSSDFRDHPIGQLVTGLFESHDRSCFQITAFSTGVDKTDKIQTRIAGAANTFLEVGNLDDVSLSQLIHESDVDILVSLNGLTTNHRSKVFARRPSPIQINYLGFPGTLGANYMDYIVGDKQVIKENEEKFYAEKIVYLPETFMPSDSKRPISDKAVTRKDEGLPERSFVFCCFNNSYKITPQVFDVWMRLLHEVPESVLWLAIGNEYSRENLQREAEIRNIAANRIIYAKYHASNEEHLARLRLADIFLDTLPYNAHSTANDALWAGLPVLTCAGDTFAGRVSGSLLRAIGLSELVTQSLAEYEALALKLARDPNLLATIKEKLSTNRLQYPLFNTERYTRHIESAYKSMWTRFQKGQNPRSFSVDSED